MAKLNIPSRKSKYPIICIRKNSLKSNVSDNLKYSDSSLDTINLMQNSNQKDKKSKRQCFFGKYTSFMK